MCVSCGGITVTWCAPIRQAPDTRGDPHTLRRAQHTHTHTHTQYRHQTHGETHTPPSGQKPHIHMHTHTRTHTHMCTDTHTLIKRGLSLARLVPEGDTLADVILLPRPQSSTTHNALAHHGNGTNYSCQLRGSCGTPHST